MFRAVIMFDTSGAIARACQGHGSADDEQHARPWYKDEYERQGRKCSD